MFVAYIAVTVVTIAANAVDSLAGHAQGRRCCRAPARPGRRRSSSVSRSPSRADGVATANPFAERAVEHSAAPAGCSGCGNRRGPGASGAGDLWEHSLGID